MIAGQSARRQGEEDVEIGEFDVKPAGGTFPEDEMVLLQCRVGLGYEDILNKVDASLRGDSAKPCTCRVTLYAPLLPLNCQSKRSTKIESC
jgi:hypothetical protein